MRKHFEYAFTPLEILARGYFNLLLLQRQEAKAGIHYSEYWLSMFWIKMRDYEGIAADFVHYWLFEGRRPERKIDVWDFDWDRDFHRGVSAKNLASGTF